MNLVDSIAALAGSRCTAFRWDHHQGVTTFRVMGPTSAMHDLISRAGGVSGHRLITREVTPIDQEMVMVELAFTSMNIKTS